MTTKHLVAAATCALAFISPAYAALTALAPTEMFFAQDTAPGQEVKTPILNERARFLTQLATGAGSYGFEDRNALDTSPLAVTFTNGILGGNNPITATLKGTGQVRDVAEAGRFNTTAGGSRYWEVMSGDSGGFSIDFSRAVSAFGFYATDIGDFQGGLTMFLTPAATGAPIEEFTIQVGSTNSGQMFFWGFASRNNAYTSIRFSTTSNAAPGLQNADFFGFDDFIVADLAPLAAPGATPEPGSLALAGLALLGLGAARRRRRG